MAFLSSLLVIRPFLAFVRRSGFAPFAWYRIALGVALLGGHRRGMDARVMHWLRRRFVAGFFVMVPLIVSLLALVWIFRVIDGGDRAALPQRLRAEGAAAGSGNPDHGDRRSCSWASSRPTSSASSCFSGSKAICSACRSSGRCTAPVKQLVLAFSPDNEYGFKRVVMVRSPSRGYVLGFLTKEFSVRTPERIEPLVAVFVPTNHLYLGDVVIVPREDVFFPALSVEEGIRMFLTGGMTSAAAGHAGRN